MLGIVEDIQSLQLASKSISNGNMTMFALFLTVTDTMKAAGEVYQGSSPIES